MGTPQDGVFLEGNRFHHFLEYSVPNHGDAPAIVRAIRSQIDGDPRVVVAFGSAFWAAAGGTTPEGLRDFETIEGFGGRTAPGTQRDILIWTQGASVEDAFDAAVSIHAAVGADANAVIDQPCFVYRDSRDLTGFIDGSANPTGDKAREAALIPAGAQGEGGSFVLSQRFVHDLAAFGELPVPDQERVIGRTKPDSIELEGDAMPDDSHVSRTDYKHEGTAVKIWRRSVPFGTAAEKGLYFLAFACDLERFQLLLDRMYGVSGDGKHDRLMEFSRAVTGSYWFAPAKEALAGI